MFHSKNSGKFKLAVGMRDECCFCGVFPVLPGWLVGMLHPVKSCSYSSTSIKVGEDDVNNWRGTNHSQICYNYPMCKNTNFSCTKTPRPV